MTDPRRLTSCPFCGMAPHVIDDDSYGWCQVGCHCDAEPCVIRPAGQLSEAIALWNRRRSEDIAR